MAAAMREVVGAAAGITGFAIESARDLVQYMVRRGQMTQEEADRLIKEAEAAHSTKKPSASRSLTSKSLPAVKKPSIVTPPRSASPITVVKRPEPAAMPKKLEPVHVKHPVKHPVTHAAAKKPAAKPAAKKLAAKPATSKKPAAKKGAAKAGAKHSAAPKKKSGAKKRR
jgi:hypothetical protein